MLQQTKREESKNSEKEEDQLGLFSNKENQEQQKELMLYGIKY